MESDTPACAPGPALRRRAWSAEAALRLLRNSLDPRVAEAPLAPSADLGPLLAALEELSDQQTLLVRDWAPVAVFATSAAAPRVLSSGSGDWAAIGPQALLPAAVASFAAAAENWGGTLAGRLVLCAGLRGPGSAQPLAATLHGAACLVLDADVACIQRRTRAGYCDIQVNDLEEALRILKNAVRLREPRSVALAGEPAAALAELARRGVAPDLLAFSATPAACREPVAEFLRNGAAELGPAPDDDRACLRWIALSGEAADLAAADALALRLFSDDAGLRSWLELARKHIRSQGLPARACRLLPPQQLRFALALNEMAGRGELQAPLALALDPAGADPAAALLYAFAGAHLVALEAAPVLVADGSPETAALLERVLRLRPPVVGAPPPQPPSWP